MFASPAVSFSRPDQMRGATPAKARKITPPHARNPRAKGGELTLSCTEIAGSAGTVTVRNRN